MTTGLPRPAGEPGGDLAALEYHHDGSGRVDLAAFTDVSGYLAPESAGVFDPRGFLDYNTLGGLESTGMWLRICSPDLGWEDLLRAIQAQVPAGVLPENVGAMKLIHQTLGREGVVGLVGGQSPYGIRLMGSLRRVTGRDLEACIFGLDEQYPGVLPVAAPRLLELLRNGFGASASAIGFDFDAGGLRPVVGIEFLDRSRRLRPSLERLLMDGLGIQVSQMDEMLALANPLPVVEEVDLRQHDFGRYLGDLEAPRTFSATLNHLKVTLRPGGENSLKTYIRLMLEPFSYAEPAFRPEPPAAAAPGADIDSQSTGQPEGDPGLP